MTSTLLGTKTAATDALTAEHRRIREVLKVLEHAGLISRSRTAQWRPCRLQPEALRTVDDWLEEYRRLWEERFDRLDDYLRELQAKTKEGGDGGDQ